MPNYSKILEQSRSKLVKKSDQSTPTSGAQSADSTPSTNGGFFSTLSAMNQKAKEYNLVQNFITGQLKGAASTAMGVASLGSQALKAGYDATIGNATGQEAIDTKPLVQDVKENTLKPNGIGEGLGFGSEQLGEFAVPAGGAAKATNLAEKVATEAPKIVSTGEKIAQGIGKVATESLDAGLKTAAQTDDAEQGAIASGITATIPAIGVAKNLLMKTPMGEAILGTVEKGASKLINSVIKPAAKEFSFGKNPGLGVAQEGITANSFEDLANKINEKKTEIGNQIGEALKGFSDKKIDISKALTPLDTAIENAVRMGPEGQSLVTRLQHIKDGMTGVYKNVAGTITRTGEKALQVTPEEAAQIKSELGSMMTWTGQAFDNQVNQTKAKVYGALKDMISEAVPQVQKLNERYANLVGASNAVERTAAIKERQNLLGFTDTLGAGGTVALLATGHYAQAGQLLAATIGRKALSSVAGKTNLANFLSKLEPGEAEQMVKASPAFAALLRSAGLLNDATSEQNGQ